MDCVSKILRISLLFVGVASLLSTCQPPDTNNQEPLPVSQSPCKGAYTALLSSPSPERTMIDPTKEPRYQDQWYLKNTTGGIDINVAPVWKKGYGTKSVNVGILDNTIDKIHLDLKDNILEVRDFHPYDTKKSHGTNVAGLIAATDNGKGILGVAPRAKIYSYGLPQEVSMISQQLLNITKSLNSSEHTTIAVYNSSFGDGGNSYKELSSPIKEAMDKVTRDGFHGKGTSLVFSAGNKSLFGNSANTSYLNHHAVITVNGISKLGIIPSLSQGVPFYSQSGINLFITAPAIEMLTTDNENRYKEDFGGTSAAAPLVSGAIALLRSEFPNLTWRDVKLILAESAKKHDYKGNALYQRSGVKYSDCSEQQYSRKMGFGLLDVEAAFTMANNWTLLPPMQESTRKQEIPLSIKSKEKYASTLEITESSIDFIESVILTMEIKKTISPLHLFEWKLQMISPDGIEGSIYKHINIPYRDMTLISTNTLTFVVNSFLGSKADGTWTLEIQQNHKDIINEITNWSLTFRGH